jgi:hypothetical protein
MYAKCRRKRRSDQILHNTVSATSQIIVPVHMWLLRARISQRQRDHGEEWLDFGDTVFVEGTVLTWIEQ